MQKYTKGITMSLNIIRMTVGEIRTNCYIVSKRDSKEAVIIDPGAEGKAIENRISAYGLKPAAILLTHGHMDHIGAVDYLREVYNIKVYAYEDEKEVLETDYNLGTMFGYPVTCKADVFFKDEEILKPAGMDIKVIHTPGHTKGSCCFYMESEKTLFSGDTLFCGSYGRTDFPTGSQSDIIRSITGRLLILDKDTKVYPGHEEETTIGSEIRYYGSY